MLGVASHNLLTIPIPPDRIEVTQSGLWASLHRHAFSVQFTNSLLNSGQGFMMATPILFVPFCDNCGSMFKIVDLLEDAIVTKL